MKINNEDHPKILKNQMYKKIKCLNHLGMLLCSKYD